MAQTETGLQEAITDLSVAVVVVKDKKNHIVFGAHMLTF